MSRLLTFMAALVLASIIGLASPAYAQATNPPDVGSGEGGGKDFGCPDSKFLGENFFKSVCWKCMFPLRIAGRSLGPDDSEADYGTQMKDAMGGAMGSGGSVTSMDPFGKNVGKRLPDKPAKAFCLCPGRTMGYPSPGFTWGYWEPSHFIEVVRKPYCSPLMGTTLIDEKGKEMPKYEKGGGGGGGQVGGEGSLTEIKNKITKVTRWGGHSTTGADQTSDREDVSFYHYHWVKAPYSYLSDWLESSACSPGGGSGGDMEYVWISEIDPTWTDSELALKLHPETKILANPIAQAACIGDGVWSTIKKPIDTLFWCAGTWGSLYPHVGWIGTEGSPPRETSLLAARALSTLHRRGMAKMRYGDKSVCKDRFWFVLPKQQYRMQTFHPIAETKNNHWIGASTFRWGEWRNKPVVGEDFVYLVSAYFDCCFTFW